MAIGVPSLNIDSAAPDHAQHLTTDVNDAFNRLVTATNDANAALETSVSDLADDVTALTTIVDSTGWRKISTQTVGAVATVDFISGIDSTYDCYMITIAGLIPGVDGADLYLRVSVNGGSSWESDAADYSWHYFAITDAAASAATGAAGDTQVTIATQVGNAAGEVLSSTIHLFQPSTAALNSHQQKTSCTLGSGVGATNNGGFRFLTASAFNGVRFYMSSGTISGVFALYGLKK